MFNSVARTDSVRLKTIVDRELTLLLDHLERTKLARAKMRPYDAEKKLRLGSLQARRGSGRGGCRSCGLPGAAPTRSLENAQSAPRVFHSTAPTGHRHCVDKETKAIPPDPRAIQPRR
jgi:hypothetical protein